MHKYKLGNSERIVYALYFDKKHCTIVYVGDREDIDYSKLPDIPYDEMKKKEVAGSSRVVAITPQQKEMKKDYLLQHHLQSSKGLPTWEQVHEMIEEQIGDKFVHRQESYTDDYRGGYPQRSFDGKILELVGRSFGKDVAKTVSDSHTRNGDWEEAFLVAVGDWAESNVADVVENTGYYYNDSEYEPQDLEDYFVEWAAYELVMDEFQERYRSLVRMLERQPHVDCYRLISLPENVDPSSLDGLGIYWSLDPDKVGLYEADGDDPKRPVYWRFDCRGEMKYVDLWETVMHHLNPDYGMDEDEVRFFPHSPIYVEEAEEITGFRRGSVGPSIEHSGYDVGRVIEIEAMRRC